MFKLDPNVEQLLTSLRIVWTEGSAKVADIDLTSSERLQNRYKTHSETVDIYAGQYRVGVEFPAVVLLAVRDGKYEILDGNNRSRGAWKAGIEELPAAIVQEISDKQKVTFLACTNATHGQPLDSQERLDSAVLLVANGVATKKASRLTGASLERINARLAVSRTHQRLGGIGRDLDDSIIKTFSTIGSDNVLKPAVQLASTATLTRDEQRDLLKKIKAVHTEAEQVAVIKEFGKDLRLREKATAGGLVPLPPEVKKLERLLAGLSHFEPSILAGVDQSYFAELREPVKHARERLDEIAEMIG